VLVGDAFLDQGKMLVQQPGGLARGQVFRQAREAHDIGEQHRYLALDRFDAALAADQLLYQAPRQIGLDPPGSVG
jgi:hypothetical protein